MALLALELLSVFETHPSEDALEEYVKGSMPTPDQAHLEEHILVCGECCKKLEATIFVLESFKDLRDDLRTGPNRVPNPA